MGIRYLAPVMAGLVLYGLPVSAAEAQAVGKRCRTSRLAWLPRLCRSDLAAYDPTHAYQQQGDPARSEGRSGGNPGEPSN
jgi:hypothetical protein